MPEVADQPAKPKRVVGIPWTKETARAAWEKGAARRLAVLEAKRQAKLPKVNPTQAELLREQVAAMRRSLLKPNVGAMARAALMDSMLKLLGRLERAEDREREAAGQPPRTQPAPTRASRRADAPEEPGGLAGDH